MVMPHVAAQIHVIFLPARLPPEAHNKPSYSLICLALPTLDYLVRKHHRHTTATDGRQTNNRSASPLRFHT
ncbi:hypothetical protein LZ30DRAFT_451015 [Colletotrichum cereale]|nr:hypothetical protein LZ30DRAFT_451015 [Colletotrichum cereale]